MKFHHFCPPGKLPLATTWKKPLLDPPSRQNPSDAHDYSTWLHGRQKGGQWGLGVLGFESLSKKRLLSYFRVGKNKFHHSFPPRKIYGKIH